MSSTYPQVEEAYKSGVLVDGSDRPDDRAVLYFDIDNTLYSNQAGVNELMAQYIRNFIKTQLNLDDESAEMLHRRYYKDFGLAIEGLVRFNHIDAMEYNRRVDDSLPLNKILKPEPALRDLLLAVDHSKIKLWLFTNAYVNHGLRVIKLLGLEGIFEGITFCDYAQVPLICKPKPEMFQLAMDQAQVTSKAKCYYIDDSALNVRAALNFGWFHTVHYLEDGETPPTEKSGHYTLTSLWELPKNLPQFFTRDPTPPTEAPNVAPKEAHAHAHAHAHSHAQESPSNGN